MKTKIQHVEPQFAQRLDNPFKSVLQELRYPFQLATGFAFRSWTPRGGRNGAMLLPTIGPQRRVE